MCPPSRWLCRGTAVVPEHPPHRLPHSPPRPAAAGRWERAEGVKAVGPGRWGGDSAGRARNGGRGRWQRGGVSSLLGAG